MMHVSLNLDTPAALRALARFANELADIASPIPSMEDQLSFDLPVPIAPVQKVGPASAFDLPSVRAAADAEPECVVTAEPVVEPTQDVPAWRRRGLPIPGKARRTQAQIAQDDEAAALCEQAGVRLSSFDEALDAYQGDFVAALDDIRRLIPSVAPEAAVEQPQIRTNPENRAPVDEAEPVEQALENDKLDKIVAEAEAVVETTALEKDLTHEDVRTLLGAFVKKFGLPVAQANIQRLIGAEMITGIPNNQKALRLAADTLRKAIEEGI